jgi:hypothetical protein
VDDDGDGDGDGDGDDDNVTGTLCHTTLKTMFISTVSFVFTLHIYQC